MHFAIPAFTFILGYLLMGSTPSEAKLMRVNQLGNQFNPMFKFMPSQRLSQQNRRDQVLRSWRQRQMCLARCKRQAEENPDKVVLRAERSIREKRQCGGGGCGGGCGCCSSCCTPCCNSCCSCGCQSNPIVILVPNNDCGCSSCGCSSCGCSSCCQSCCCSPCCSCGGCSSCGGGC